MNATQPSIINEPATTATPRCQHRSLKGRCRQLATGSAATLCFDHARAEQQAKNDFTLLAPLVRKCEDFHSAEVLNETLGALHNLLAEGRISPRRARRNRLCRQPHPAHPPGHGQRTWPHIHHL